jgi:hypothetical protein
MKLLIAIIAKDDKDETEHRLTAEGFMLTEMGTTGGFLKRKNVTLLIGTSEEKTERVKEILKQTAGRRSVKMYYQSTVPVNNGLVPPQENMSVPLESETGGCTVFELNADSITKF